jgi:hypothetical protein
MTLKSLNAWFQEFCRQPGMHHSMHRGSMARAASTAPISATSQPNSVSIAEVHFLEDSSLPQMSIVGESARNICYPIPSENLQQSGICSGTRRLLIPLKKGIFFREIA